MNDEAETKDNIKAQDIKMPDFEWTTENEVHLFHAMIGHKPVGIAKSFHMACILDKFTRATNHDISSKVIWDHLDTMYDMSALHESEPVPFSVEPEDFTLPEDIMELVPPRLQDRGADSRSASSQKDNSTQGKKSSSKSESKKEGVKKKIVSGSKPETSTPKATGGKVKLTESQTPQTNKESGGKVWKGEIPAGKSSSYSGKHSSKSGSSSKVESSSKSQSAVGKPSKTAASAHKSRDKGDSRGSHKSSSAAAAGSGAKGGGSSGTLRADSDSTAGGQKRKRISQDSKSSTPLKKSQQQ